jgi:hypothetical protein
VLRLLACTYYYATNKKRACFLRYILIMYPRNQKIENNIEYPEGIFIKGELTYLISNHLKDYLFPVDWIENIATIARLNTNSETIIAKIFLELSSIQSCR